MRIGVLANEGSWYWRDIVRAADERGLECRRLEFERLVAAVSNATPGLNVTCEDCDLLELDALIVRTMPPGSLEQVVFRMDVLGVVESRGTLVHNPPKALECAVDKFLTTARLQRLGVPVPRTVVCESADDALAQFDRLGGDVVVKPLFGSEGRGILRVSDPDLAFRTFRTLQRTSAVLYLQQYVDHGGVDTRVLVYGDSVLGGMRRRAADGFRTNVARLGHAEPYSPSDDECAMAVRAARITGAVFAGVDLIADRAGRIAVLEVNAVPGWRAFARVTGLDVAGTLLERIQASLANPRPRDVTDESTRQVTP